MGTLPVFMTAISTILGAILFLRFGYSVAHVGLAFTLLIILIGHLVTVPTAMAVAEIATNQKVEGGGAYYMISRSFGLNIGGAIGIALFLSQAVSVAFYIIAFTKSCGGLIEYVDQQFGVALSPWMINYGFMALLTLLMLTKGANVGVKALYGVVVILFISLAMFFVGQGPGNGGSHDIFQTIPESFVTANGETVNRFSFFQVFTFIFPAFTGIAAGLGLSGDLKDPKVSIPKGTMWATLCGIVVYIAVAFKLFYSAPLEDLAADELYMREIAVWGPIIPIGLACAAVSSALGSIMIAPRTLQALGSDKIIPGNLSNWLGKGRNKDNEPINASLITVVIGFIVVGMDDINAVAEIISMFFMVTYGAICMVSFFEHMAADPKYRPTFRSKWYVSLFGGLLCFFLMFQMNLVYAIVSVALMILMYIWISYKNKDRKGIANLFKGIIFQITRGLKLMLQ
ncbi:MAG: amino acid permease, partial [Flavobacteriales bacterium]|nr:amino acid permease [Flavobacteriales bacterium]